MIIIHKNYFVALLFIFFNLGVAYAQPSIYMVRQTGVLAKANIDGSNFTVLNDDIGQGNGVAIDAAAGKVYYSDGAGGTIKRANLDGTGEETIVGVAGNVFGIELDLKNNRLYWVDRSASEVKYVNLSSPSTVNTLTTINGAFSVTVIVDTINNKVYYNHVGNGNNNGEIVCYDLSNNTENIIVSGLDFPSGMVLFENKIYWTDFDDGTIIRADLDGTNMETIEMGVVQAIGLAIDPTSRKIYISQQGGAQDVYCSSVDDASNDNVMIIDGTGTPEHIALLLTSPEIDITGNSNAITDSDDCDTAPSSSNDTDFGNVVVAGADNTNTFTIQNTGELTLNLTNPSSLISIGGMHASDFTVTQQPTSSIASSGNTTFQIKFDPSASGLREATVTIINNDCDESTFCFKIQGTGIDCPDGLSAIIPAKATITESSCSTFGSTPMGGTISAPVATNCPTESTLQYSTDNITFSATLPVYNQTTSETIYTKCVCNTTNTTTSTTASIMTSPMACPDCPNFTSVTPAQAVITESTCNGSTPTGGDVSVPAVTNCPTGSTLQFSTDNSTFSTTLPTYNQTTSETIYTKCVCNTTNTTTSTTSSVVTSPMECPDCPNFTSVTPAQAVITESTCNGSTSTGGVISAPAITNCPTGSTLQYSVDNSSFSTSLPTYDVDNSQTIYTKCICDNMASAMSAVSQINTSPLPCGPTIPTLTADDLSIGDPCSCSNPDNILLSDGRFLFQDVLEVKTATGLMVSLTTTDNNLLNVNGDAIADNTLFNEVSTGVYELEFYTLPNIPASVTVSNGTSSQDFTTDSCSICPSEPIPTFNQWALFIYVLLLLNLGLIGLNMMVKTERR